MYIYYFWRLELPWCVIRNSPLFGVTNKAQNAPMSHQRYCFFCHRHGSKCPDVLLKLLRLKRKKKQKTENMAGNIPTSCQKCLVSLPKRGWKMLKRVLNSGHWLGSCLAQRKLPTFTLATGLRSHIRKQRQLKSECPCKDQAKLYLTKLSSLKHRMDISSPWTCAQDHWRCVRGFTVKRLLKDLENGRFHYVCIAPQTHAHTLCRRNKQLSAEAFVIFCATSCSRVKPPSVGTVAAAHLSGPTKRHWNILRGRVRYL